jgi:hypothetical protein
MRTSSKSSPISPRWPIFGLRFLVTLVALVLGGCGKPLTAQDCEQIVTRITELELKEAAVSDPSQISQQVAETQKTFRERALSECVGRRLPASSLECVKRATSARQIVEECFD